MRDCHAGTANLLAAAIKKHQEGQPEEAAKIYREILSSSPNHVDALHFLGVAEHQLGRSERALEHINRALEQMLDHPDALNNRGNILKKAGRKSTRLNSSHLVISYAVFCL